MRLDMGQACMEMAKARSERTGRIQDPGRYVASWSEREVLDGEEVQAFVLILRTRGCRWARTSGCSFCGYVSDADPDVTVEDLKTQLYRALDRYDGEPFFKIYTSGSFLDDGEIPVEFQEHVLELVHECGARRLLVETLPQFATNDKVKWMVDGFKGDLGVELALGLESASPAVLKDCVNKPAKVEDFIGTARQIRTLGGRVRMYIVIKPPLLTEGQALEDAVASAGAVKDVADTISFNPINIQGGTVVERLWRKGEYQPPWLWTVVEVLKRTAGFGPRVVSGPTGGGTKRGAHNCRSCDRFVLRGIQQFSVTGNIKDLDRLHCSCRDLWRDQLELEDHVHGPFVMDRG